LYSVDRDPFALCDERIEGFEPDGIGLPARFETVLSNRSE
jgi:hypothetical protein